MHDLSIIFQLFRCCSLADWPALVKYLLFEALHREARIDLKLRREHWVVISTKPSGLRFYYEVVIKESYSKIRRDLLALSDPIVIDAGANCGAFALWALSVNPGARVISCEPGDAFEMLSINRNLYVRDHGDRWQVEKCALSSKVGTCHFAQHANSSMGSFSEDGPEVPMRTMDDLGLSPQVLKIDVEGAELEVLKGSEKALATAGVVVLEYHTQELRSQCIDFLTSRHFTVEEEKMLLIGRK
jgi:FkbM family methyltransferase